MSRMQTLADELRDRLAENIRKQSRLVATLQYYGWLEQHGLRWDCIRGARKLPNTPRNRRHFHETCRRLQRPELIRQYDYACYIRQSGCMPWVPVPDDYDGPEPVQYREEPYRGPFVCYQLVDGGTAVLPYPPYEEDVIYGRTNFE